MEPKTTGELLNVLKNAHSPKELQDYREQYTIDEQSRAFHIEFCGLADRRQLSRADIVRRSMLDRTYAYQILNGTRTPGRDKIIALGIAAECSLKEIQHLLTYSQEGILYSRSSRDAVLIYCIEHHLDVLHTNYMLEGAGEPILE